MPLGCIRPVVLSPSVHGLPEPVHGHPHESFEPCFDVGEPVIHAGAVRVRRTRRQPPGSRMVGSAVPPRLDQDGQLLGRDLLIHASGNEPEGIPDRAQDGRPRTVERLQRVRPLQPRSQAV